MRGHVDILTLSPRSTFAIHCLLKNNCYRSTTLLFGLGRTIRSFTFTGKLHWTGNWRRGFQSEIGDFFFIGEPFSFIILEL